MKTKENMSDTPPISAEEVEIYIRNNPDFFLTRQDLLADMAIPHGTGAAVSLVEKQVKVLREQNEQARKTPA